MDFKKKAELFHDFFTKECSLVNNKSELSSVFTLKMWKSLSTDEFLTYVILKIIRNLNPNKAHGHNMINIRVLQICDRYIWKQLGIIFRSCLQLENGKRSPQNRKKPM